MSRITGLFCMRGKGFNAIKYFQHRMTSNIHLAEANFPEKIKETLNDYTDSDNRIKSDLFVVSTKSRIQRIIGHPSDSLNAREIQQILDLEDIFTVLDDYSIEKTLQLLKFLALKNFRSVKVLNAISKALSTKKEKLTSSNFSDIFFCWSVLSYKDKESLDIISNTILSDDKIYSSKISSSILCSIGRLKYRNVSLINFLIKHLSNDVNEKNPNQLLTVLLTLATVDYMCPEGEHFLKLLSNYKGVDFIQTQSYAQFVWATVILNNLMENHISEVLSEEYLNLLSILDASIGKNIPLFLKLQNINGAALHLMPSYSGAYLQKAYNRPLYSKYKSQFLISVVDSLTHLFPKHGHIKTMKDTEAGFVLDIECCVDSKGNPVSLAQSDGQIKIAMLLSDFNDFCICDEEIKTGLTSFKERILTGMGYRVINMPYTEYQSSLQLKDKKIYLQKKINECL